jgi:hypothetical protein
LREVPNTILENKWKIRGLGTLNALSLKNINDPKTRKFFYTYLARPPVFIRLL